MIRRNHRERASKSFTQSRFRDPVSQAMGAERHAPARMKASDDLPNLAVDFDLGGWLAWMIQRRDSPSVKPIQPKALDHHHSSTMNG